MTDFLQPKSSFLDANETESLLLELVDHLDAMVAYWDGQQVCRFANMAYKQWFGRGREQLLGITLKELLGPLYEKNLVHIEAAYRGERQVFERAIPRPDGSGMRHSLATYIPRLVNNQVAGIFVHVADVDRMKQLEMELETANDQLEELATHDFLTGLPNRRLLDDRFNEAIERAKRTGENFYVLCVDVDNFKQINDCYGHAFGDQYLVEIASRIKSCTRAHDTVARIGGDEFLILATSIPSDEGIVSLATRLVDSAHQPYEIGQIALTPSISVGVAKYPEHGAMQHLILLSADRALYAAKEAGRNCFFIYEPE